MSFHQLKTPGRELALITYTLAGIPKYYERVQRLGSVFACLGGPGFRFTHQALAMLVQLCDFDTQQVLKEISSLASNPNPPEAVSDPCNGFRRLWRCKYPFQNYHYLIKYSRTAAGVVIEDVLFDDKRFGPKGNTPGLERNMLYHVRSSRSDRYRDVKDADEAKALTDAWNISEPTTRIRTRHAAVNGMLNNLKTARWLMGTHLDVAYPEAQLTEYTLFHNPTDGITLADLAECIWDKIAPLPFMASCQVQHLADHLWQRQTSGHQTDWVVHSQGAIIFKAAVRYHLQVRPGAMLDRHTVAFHAGGSVIASTRPYLEKAGVRIGLERINPCDLVPNVAGHHDTSCGGLMRSLRFMRNVTGDNGGNPSVSPHTLPYLGVCSYYLQLKEAGFHREAGTVHDYMVGLNDKQLAYERSLGDPNGHLLDKNKKAETAMA